ncbi:hypothetical protein BDU57DRAFT_180806 [Ampelomyces quisqualis]|uniref:Uncharacterized protein n=1 Tax=Ampelomyces quisqualis TaxID=50730 RepID=A0A6A5QTM1_AMPQU|nr:hypothetical protein BDU57DRAFT_180806 [Ampelomyces quisqualis]
MDSRSFEYEASVAEDSGYASDDNDDGGQNISEESDARVVHSTDAACGTLAPGDRVPRSQVRICGPTMRVTTPNRSRIPFHATTSRNESSTDARSTSVDRIIHQVRNTIDRPELSVTQQRSLCRSLDQLAVLQQAARNVQLQHVQPRAVPPPEYGPQPRPLSEAAIRQNMTARERAAHSAALQRSGHPVNLRPADADPLIRYNDAYDDLIGTRSLYGGSVLASAIRDGDDVTYARRYAQNCHNGLQYQRGHQHITSENRYLVEIRQARWLAGLPTVELDAELTYRIICEPDAWGWIGVCVRGTGWTERRRCYCERVDCGSRIVPS